MEVWIIGGLIFAAVMAFDVWLERKRTAELYRRNAEGWAEIHRKAEEQKWRNYYTDGQKDR